MFVRMLQVHYSLRYCIEGVTRVCVVHAVHTGKRRVHTAGA